MEFDRLTSVLMNAICFLEMTDLAHPDPKSDWLASAVHQKPTDLTCAWGISGSKPSLESSYNYM
jgi:hypothetical protein